MNKKLKLTIQIALNIIYVDVLFGYFLFFRFDMAPMEGFGIKVTTLLAIGVLYGVFLWKNRTKDGNLSYGIEKYFKKSRH